MDAVRWLALAMVAVVTFAGPASAGRRIVTVAGGPGEGPATQVSMAPSAVLVAGSILYVSDVAWHVVRRVDLTTGDATVTAGFGDPHDTYCCFGGDGGPATGAQLTWPWGLARDFATGDLFIADRFNNRIRKVDALTGVISTVLGDGNPGLGGEGVPYLAAEFNDPTDVLAYGGDLFTIADSENHRVRVADPVHGVLTVFPLGGTLYRPMGLASTAQGLLVVDYGAAAVARLFFDPAFPPPFVFFSRVAGGVLGSGGDGGPATSAGLENPADVAADGSGNFFIADSLNYRIRRVDGSSGVITTVAGNGTRGFLGDGGPATSAQLLDPSGVEVTPNGELYVAEGFRVRRIAGGNITTVAGVLTATTGDGRAAVKAQLSQPAAVALDGSGNIFIADRGGEQIRRVDKLTGVISTYAGTGAEGADGDGGLATLAKLSEPRGVAIDSSGTLFIADTGNNRIRRVDSAGVIHLLAGGGTSRAENVPAVSALLENPIAVAVDAAGDVYIAETDGSRVRRVSRATGLINTIADASNGLNAPRGVAVDASGRVYIADDGRERVYLAAGGAVTVYAGIGTGAFAGDDGLAVDADVDPRGVALDGSGNLYIADGNWRIRRVDAVTKIITSLAGGGSERLGEGGPATAAMLSDPEGVAVDGSGNILVTDGLLRRVRRIETTCGDGVTDPGELCDDGNTSNADACKNDCTPNTCGDGFVRTGVEDCDPGPDVPGDCCTFDCHLAPDSDGDGLCDVQDNCPANFCAGGTCVTAADCPGGYACVSGTCKGGTCASDANCPAVYQCHIAYNPDQKNSDCVSNNAGCADGGDTCDLCPDSADNAGCNHDLSDGQSIGAGGGTLQTIDRCVGGVIPVSPPGACQVKVQVPAGTLGQSTSVSVTQGVNGFKVGTNNTVFVVDFEPGGSSFAPPVEVTFKWADGDPANPANLPDGKVDGFSNLPETQLKVMTFNSGTGKYDDVTGQCGTCGASCSVFRVDNPANTCLTACNGKKCCCDVAANTWTVALDHFSEYAVADAAGTLVTGSGAATTDCGLEWTIVDPLETPETDHRGLPNPRRSCVDGDPLCDRDGLVNGSCTFAVSACVNVPDTRLACTPTDVASVQLRRPNADDRRPAAAAAGAVLHDLFAGLGPYVQNPGLKGRMLGYHPVLAANTCTAVGDVVVPLEGRRQRTLNISARAQSSGGVVDVDRLTLGCRAH